MNGRYPLLLGWRFFRAGTGNRLVSFVSLLAVAGLVTGVALMILVMSVMNGFDREMRTRILALVPHLQLYREGGVEQWPILREELLARAEVATASPFVRISGMLNYRGKVTGVELLGIDPSMPGEYRKLGKLGAKGNAAGEAGAELLISAKIARELQVTEGGQVVLLVPQNGASESGGMPAMRIFTVAGIFNTHTLLDKSLVITRLPTAANIAGLWSPGKASAVSSVVPAQGLQLGLVDVFSARDIGYQLLEALPSGFTFVDWMQTHGNLYQAIEMSRKMVGLLVFAVIAVAVFNVIAMLVMTVVEKRPAIAILKTQGASRAGILMAFLVQGSLIGIFGVMLGCAGGVLASLCVEDVVASLQRWAGVQLLNLEVYPVDYIPVDLRALDVLLVALIALALNLLATLYPAWKASAVMPAQVLRYE